MKDTFELPISKSGVQISMSPKQIVFSTQYRNEKQINLPPVPWVHPAAEVRDSTISGKGIFATRDINVNEVVLVCGGQLFRNHEIHSGKARIQSLTGFAEGIYLGTPFDAPEGTDEYLNHSCDPNLWLRDEVTLVARQVIPAGVELTVDYATWEIDESWKLPSHCNCGSIICRHAVTGKDWMLASLQERYQSHFLPCLNQRIKNRRLLYCSHFFQRLIVKPIFSKMNRIRARIQQKVQQVDGSLEIVQGEIARRAE